MRLLHDDSCQCLETCRIPEGSHVVVLGPRLSPRGSSACICVWLVPWTQLECACLAGRGHPAKYTFPDRTKDGEHRGRMDDSPAAKRANMLSRGFCLRSAGRAVDMPRQVVSLARQALVGEGVSSGARTREVYTDEIISHFHAQRALLVLDNFEHVLPVGRLVVRLLGTCPNVSHPSSTFP